jgi:transcriptional regulator with XRE-family HTH domain
VRKRPTRKPSDFSFADRLRQLRTGLELSQETVAQRAGCSAKFISQVENDHASPTMTRAIRIIVDGLGVPLPEFFRRDSGQRDEIAKIRALLAGRPVAIKRRVLNLVRAICEE